MSSDFDLQRGGIQVAQIISRNDLRHFFLSRAISTDLRLSNDLYFKVVDRGRRLALEVVERRIPNGDAADLLVGQNAELIRSSCGRHRHQGDTTDRRCGNVADFERW